MNQPILQTAPAKPEPGSRILFVSYDGLTDPLGRSQILPYLVGLSAKGCHIHVLSCDKPEALKRGREVVKGICDDAGIVWHSIPYHRRPPVLSTIYDLARMMAIAVSLHDRHRFDLLHCRSYLPALVGRRVKRLRGVPYIFDMRGFWPEERTESGDWNLANPLYRRVYSFFKSAEADLLADADRIVSLTRAAAKQIAHRGRSVGVVVIPCCVDFDHFPPATNERRLFARTRLGIARDAQVLVYLGSLGGNHLLDEMIAFYREFRRSRPNSVFLFVTRTPAEFVMAAARTQAIPPSEIVIREADRDEVPTLIAAANLGIAFKRAEFSSLACSPTKLGELLAVGIPVVANAGVGDVAEILADTGGGVALTDYSEESFRSSIDRVAHVQNADELRSAALRWFGLADGVEAYFDLYRSLTTKRAGAGTDRDPHHGPRAGTRATPA